MTKRASTLLTALLAGGVLTLIILALGAKEIAQPSVALAAPQVSVLQDVTGGAPLIHYQGRLLDPTTGQAKPDGSYQIVFSLYNVDTAGAPLWTETKNVALSRGLFSTLLGDTTALNLGDFNGQDLFLGLSVQGDPEATPRLRIAHVAYAIYAQQAANAANASTATNAANADTLDGLDGTAFSLANHTHDGAAINAGVVAEQRIDAALARDSEIMPAVLASDGAGSGLDADMIDGRDVSQLASPLKFVEWTESLAVDASRKFLTANHLVVTPPADGYLLVAGRMRYNCIGSGQTQSFFGAYVSTSATAPTPADNFTANTGNTIGHAHPLDVSSNGGDFNPHIISFPFAVTGGTTYHIWLGVSGINLTVGACSVSSPRIIATFHVAGL